MYCFQTPSGARDPEIFSLSHTKKGLSIAQVPAMYPRDSVVGRGIMLQAGNFEVPVPIRSLTFFQFTYSFQPH
jgi:hypothetical protein